MEYADMLARMHKAHVRRVGDGDPEDLARMIELYDEYGRQIGQAVRLMRAQLGWSWQDLAKACGKHRSTLHVRFGKAPETVDVCADITHAGTASPVQ
jgi:ribosome-binding protein aMBF1 (putative translation factor)